MDALVSAARAGTHAQATVRRKCQASQNTKAGDIGGLKSIKSEALMGFDSILTTSPLVKAGSRGSPLRKKNSPTNPLVANRTLVVGQDWFFPKRNTNLVKQIADTPEIKIHSPIKLKKIAIRAALENNKPSKKLSVRTINESSGLFCSA